MIRYEGSLEDFARKVEEDMRKATECQVVCRTHLDPYRMDIRYWVVPGCGNCHECTPDPRGNKECSCYQPVLLYDGNYA